MPKSKPVMPRNPFPISGIVLRPDFTNRDVEVARIRRVLQEGGAKLLVYGPRRMGKTSALKVAMADQAEDGGVACLADFSTATSTADLANRILDAATRALGRRWSDIVAELIKRTGFKIEGGFDPVTNTPTASLGFSYRDSSLADQQKTLATVLDSLEALCGQRAVTLGVILDEFQEINRFGGEQAEWHLRGVIQHHQHLAYIAAGSRMHLIKRMIGKNHAFYKLFEIQAFEAMDPKHLGPWLDQRLAGHDVTSEHAGAEILRLAGPRTRDVMQLARRTFEIARPTQVADAACVARAFSEIVQEESDPYQTLWNGLAAAQQNVLRALAAGATGLTSAATLRSFSLKTSGTALKAIRALIDSGIVEQAGRASYRFDNPFHRGWVVHNALPDVGIHQPDTFMP